jgi:ER membrane protein complex subunit 7
MYFIQRITLLFCITIAYSQDMIEEPSSTGLYQVEGKVYNPELQIENSFEFTKDTELVLNSGEYKGFLKSDGTFVINKVPSGSYILEIINPDYVYESVRVEINSKGKMRARKVNVSVFLPP